jgi:hypothetical protein
VEAAVAVVLPQELLVQVAVVQVLMEALLLPLQRELLILVVEAVAAIEQQVLLVALEL